MFLDERRIRHRTTWQAEFSLAYVHAIASAAGVACHVMRVDIDGIDVLLVGDSSEGAVRFPKLDVQIKSWTGAVQDGDYLRYPLKVENYDVLRLPNDRVYTPAILVLVVMPPSQADWFCMTRTEATLGTVRTGSRLLECRPPPTAARSRSVCPWMTRSPSRRSRS